MHIQIKKTKPTGVIPKKSDEQAIAYDVFIPVTQRVRMGRVKIPLHIAISLPYNVEAKIEPRSGTSLKGVLGCTRVEKEKPEDERQYKRFNCNVLIGKIDPGYKDDICIILQNFDKPFYLMAGTRIAQITFYPVLSPILDEVEELDIIDRGGGFSHSGDF